MSQSVLYPHLTPSRQRRTLNGIWKLKFDPDKVGQDQKWADGLPQPMLFQVPSDWSTAFMDKFSREFRGDVWFELDFYAPLEMEGSNVEIQFESLRNYSHIYINGLEIIQHAGNGAPFSFKVDPILHYGSFNRLTILMNHEPIQGCIPCGYTINLMDENPQIIEEKQEMPNGIDRSVWLTSYPKDCLGAVDLEIENLDDMFLVNYSIQTNTSKPLLVQMFKQNGELIDESSLKEGFLKVPKDADNKNESLYTMKISIQYLGSVVDEYLDYVKL